MKFASVLSFLVLTSMTNADSPPVLRRRLVSPCSADQLTDNACAMPDGTVGATVCRYSFTACIHPREHNEHDICGACPAPPETPRQEAPEFPEPPLCSTVDASDFACDLPDGSPGALICHMGFTACIPKESVKGGDFCGCCFGDTHPRCQQEEEARNMDLVLKSESIVCDALQMEEFACDMPDGTVGSYVCRGGFSACVGTKDHRPSDTCGICPVIEHPEQPRVEPETQELPVCGTVKLGDFACSLPGGETGALICVGGFSACRNLDAIHDDDACGCCPGDMSSRCFGNTALAAVKSYEP